MSTIHYPRFTVCRINASGERIAVTSATITAYNVTAASSLSSTSSDSEGNVAAGTYTGTVGDVIRFGHATYPEYIYFTSTATAAEAYTHPDNIEVAYVAENLATNTIPSQMVELYAQDTDNLDVTPWKIGEGYSGTTVEIPFQSNVAKNLRIFPRTIDNKLGRVRQSFNITTGSQTVAVPATDTIVALDPAAWYSVRRNAGDTAFETYDTRASRPLFEHFVTRTTTATTEQTLHLYNVARSQFQTNGDTILADYTGTTASNANAKTLRIYFAATEIFNSEDVNAVIGNDDRWNIRVCITRKNTSTVRCSTTILIYGYDAFTAYSEITGLDLPDRLGVGSGTAYDLKLTAETGTAAGDVSLYMAEARFVNAAPVSLPPGLWAAYEARSFNGTGVAVPSDGANITTSWQDLTGNANHATVSGSPTFETGELNGEAIVRFGADSNDYFTIPSMDAFTAATIAIVWKITNTTTNAGNNFGDSGDAPSYPLSADGIIYDEFATTVRKTCGTPVTSLTAYHTTLIWSASNDWQMELNGMLQYATTTNTVGSPTAPTFGFNGSTGYLKADVAAIYIDNAKMTAANVALLYRYIGQVFGV